MSIEKKANETLDIILVTLGIWFIAGFVTYSLSYAVKTFVNPPPPIYVGPPGVQYDKNSYTMILPFRGTEEELKEIQKDLPEELLETSILWYEAIGGFNMMLDLKSGDTILILNGLDKNDKPD